MEGKIETKSNVHLLLTLHTFFVVHTWGPAMMLLNRTSSLTQTMS